MGRSKVMLGTAVALAALFDLGLGTEQANAQALVGGRIRVLTA